MHVRRRTVAGVAAFGLAAGALSGAGSAAARTPARVPVVVAHVSSSSISLSTGARMHAGRVIFRVVTGRGDHELQVARLHSGYSLAQAGADLNASFQGDVAAIRRIDDNITFRGGAEARPQRPGAFGVSLTAGRYLLIDQDSNATTWLRVTGTAQQRAKIAHQSRITTFSYGFGTTPAILPASGWTRIYDRSDQPHFVVLNHVRKNTTNAMVRRYFASGGESQPAFALRANTSAGVISPDRGETVHYSLPAGRYLLACYWPDDDSGMPHAFMGMWKLVTLR